MPSRRGSLGSLPPGLHRLDRDSSRSASAALRSRYVNTPYIPSSLGRYVAVHIVEEKSDLLWLRGAPNEAHVDAGANRSGDEGEWGGDENERDREHDVPPELVLRA